ncbi:hypothetical protein FKP32DRAFT_1084604 [Trametes sanguinea]|nr:hypothetical protein FKP32DRAFT_1084604 [Trametes sanguinea]
MCLLNTRTGLLERLSLDGTTNTPYAILSYVQEIENATSLSAPAEAPSYPSKQPSTSIPSQEDLVPLSHLSPTIRNACQVASDSGYDHLWIQGYCIDRSDPTALSRALNATWDWHARAGACYVYLADVSPEDVATRADSQFRQSSWHRDVWALQALVASPKVLFLARDWSVVGTKSTLAAVLEEVTGVDRSILMGAQSVHDVSVARRMWWASRRRTTSVEDCAYALLGLFGVEMSVEYGEGSRAFLRLQEEIFRRTLDQSLFAWHYHLGHEHPDCLFAPSPCCFARSGDIRPIPYRDLAARLDLPPDTGTLCTPQLTSEQLSIRLPLIPHQIPSFPPTSALYEVFGVAARFSDVAILQCEDAQGRLVVLTLDPAPGSTPGEEYLVRAVETTLGQCDRTWSYSPVLYREAVKTKDVVIHRGALRSPWLPHSLQTLAQLYGGEGTTAPGSRVEVVLEEATLPKQGFDIRYKASQRELIDDLYVRARRARRFVDVHEFTLSTGEAREESAAESVTVEIVTRRHSLVPVSLDSIRVRYTSDGGRSVDAKCLMLTPVVDVRDTFTARYALHLGHSATTILRLSLSRSSTAHSTYLLSLDIDGTVKGSELVTDPTWVAYQRVGGDNGPSRATGRVMDVFPRLPSIRGWTTSSVKSRSHQMW